MNTQSFHINTHRRPIPTKIKAKGPPPIRNSQITIDLLGAILGRLSHVRHAARNSELAVEFLSSLLSFVSELFEAAVSASPDVAPELAGGETAGEVVEVAAAERAETRGVARGEKVRS